MNLLQMLSNPQQNALNMINSNPAYKNNPVIQNALNMAQQGNTEGLMKLANNYAQSNGINLNQLLKQFGM